MSGVRETFWFYFCTYIISGSKVDGVSPSVFRCTSTPMETGPIVTYLETQISPDLKE